MRKRDFLIKVNKPPRCHNPHKSLTPRRLFAAKTLFQSIFQLHSIFCLHSITVVTLSKPIHFVVMKRSRTEKSPWIKSKTKLGPNKKKIDEIHSDRGLNLAESDKGSWSINSRKARKLVLHLWMYQQSVRKIMGAKKAEEKNVTRERLPRTSRDYSSSSDSLLSETSPRFVLVSWKYVFFPFVLSFVDHGYVCLLETALQHLLFGLLLFWRSTSLPYRLSHS